MTDVAINRSGRLKFPFVRELDGIRACAILLVFVSHLGTMGRLVPGGLGVTLFFFLSGFLITSLLRAEAATTGRIDLGQFYARRTLRIFPPLYITLAFSGVLVALGLVARDPDWPSVTAQLLFVSNYARWWGWEQGLPGPPLWSLAVEEHFYLVFPAIFALLLMKLSGRRAALTCAILCLVPLAFRLVNGLVYGEVAMNYVMSHTRIDSILFGCCLALWQNPVLDKDAWKPGPIAVVLGIGAVLVAALVRDPFFGDTWRYTIQGAGMFVAFSWVLHGTRWTSAILNWAPLQLIGRYSYTLYLVHWLFISLITTWSPVPLPLAVVGAGTMVLSMLYAAAMFYVVERPLARIRHRLHREPAPAPEIESVATGDPQPRAA
jgi:peptidoglycan/LPS O-acetylase OafA/YrhL